MYASILVKRLTEDIEAKEVIPDNQAGFRKDRGALENIFVLRHTTDKEIQIESRKVRGPKLKVQGAVKQTSQTKY